MRKCKYVRKEGSNWEYGHIEVLDAGTKIEKRKYVPTGTTLSYEEACARNTMALEGQPKVRPHIANHGRDWTWN